MDARIRSELRCLMVYSMMYSRVPDKSFFGNRIKKCIYILDNIDRKERDEALYELNKNEEYEKLRNLRIVEQINDYFNYQIPDTAFSENNNTNEHDDNIIQIAALKSNYAAYIESLKKEMEEIRQQRSILFTGVFNGGKSTLINALIGNEILKTAAKAETATITRIMFGRDEEKVEVFYNDKHPKGVHIEKITIEEYKKYFRLENGEPDIDTIDHVEIELRESIPNNSIQFIDSLGLDSAAKESEITKVYEPKANAVVFLLNATCPCTIAEQERIAVKYYNKYLKNVFFVVSRIDLLSSQQEVDDVKERTEEILHNVFIDDNNRFDEELFKKRVFYVNAYGAFNVRNGRPNEMYIGGKRTVIPITIDETGICEFEEALYEYMKAPRKDVETAVRNLKIKLNIVEPKYRELCNEKEMTDFKLKYYQEFYYNIIKSM